jgi:hypothetical protein
MTRNQIELLYNNPVLFINQCIKHQSLDELIDFKLLPFQEEMVNKFHQHKMNICSSLRCTGKSSTPLYYLLYQAIFNDYSNILISSFKREIAINLLERLVTAYKNIDNLYYKNLSIPLPKIIKSNKQDFELDNGSRIIASNIGHRSVCGQTFSNIFLDEFALVPYEVAKAFMDVLYPIVYSTKTTKLIITSTKSAGSYFNVLLDDAKNGLNNFVASEFDLPIVL